MAAIVDYKTFELKNSSIMDKIKLITNECCRYWEIGANGKIRIFKKNVF